MIFVVNVWSNDKLPLSGYSNLQVVSMSRLEGTDQPMEVLYFVEGPSGERVPAVQMADLLNSLDVQKAAIVLGYRVQGILAQRKCMTNIQYH